jgi:serine/threonine protein kinase
MSEVYLARDIRLDRLVAVKVLSAQTVRKTDGVQRFEREAQAAARLEHPNVATVFYSGTHEGKPYYAMELIRGWSFRELVESRVSFSLDQILPLFAQACVGLEAAFLSGVTHRDVKPGNLMIAESGQLKVVDFGLARLSEEDNRRKRRGIMGTPFYLAPEVIEGSTGDHRSDLYSLGVTLWEVLIGRPPFDADTPHEVLRQHVTEEAPTLTEHNTALPAELSELVVAMMSKDPQDRPDSFEEVHARLRDLDATEDQLSRLLRWCSNQRVNSFVDGPKCSLCSRPYDQRTRPETFHVDLTGWNRPDARKRAARYIADALGQATGSIEELLDPLPFRAAFRARRKAARRMHRDFHEMGAEVSLVPADDAESKGQLPIQRLPLSPSWPQAGMASSAEDWPPPRQREGSPIPGPSSLLLAALLLVLSGALAILLVNSQAEISELRSALAVAEENSRGRARAHPGPASGSRQAPEPTTRGGASPVSAMIIIAPGEILDPRSTARAHGELTRAVAELTARLPALTRLTPLRVRLVQRPLWQASKRRVWLEATWAPNLEFPVSGITQVETAVLAQAANNLTARTLLRQAAGPSIPGWLLIGTATLLEGGRGASAEQPVPRTARFSVRAVPSAPGEASAAQEELSREFVSFLVERSGWTGINQVVGLLAEGRSPEEAALRGFGAALEDLELEWANLREPLPAP